ncbi:hypothetical protein SCLCIDRAFT_615604 [Scleroderma citrinum Foug A]|uniref:Non-specific serine/threonine protein kinase n=1 Tax=Scleroderma citrinum Foug A TaxID=1036808 RepID=A0A0C2ZFP2_9AGAM|nr:hypothetical protein SCLCIDRAFT_615604 [Scleroderma citrinum Foug A]
MAAASNDQLSPTRRLLACSHLISQGAEAKVYKAYLEDPPRSCQKEGKDAWQTEEMMPVLLKYRFNKRWGSSCADALPAVRRQCTRH